MRERGPATVILLSIVTFGFYWLYWYYIINKETLQTSKGVVRFSPGLSLLSQFIPIANVVSWYNTANRLRTVKKSVGDPDETSPAVCLLVALFLPVGIYTALVQSGANALILHNSRSDPQRLVG